MMHRAGILRG